MTPPSSTEPKHCDEPMYLSITMEEIDLLCTTSIDTGFYRPGSREYEAAVEKRMQVKRNILSRARGPVSAQQAPAVDIFKMCWELHDEITDPNNHLSWEEICGSLEEIADASKNHDAALLAQAKREWKRERV